MQVHPCEQSPLSAVPRPICIPSHLATAADTTGVIHGSSPRSASEPPSPKTSPCPAELPPFTAPSGGDAHRWEVHGLLPPTTGPPLRDRRYACRVIHARQRQRSKYVSLAVRPAAPRQIRGNACKEIIGRTLRRATCITVQAPPLDWTGRHTQPVVPTQQIEGMIGKEGGRSPDVDNAAAAHQKARRSKRPACHPST